MGFEKRDLDCQGEPWKMCSRDMKVYKGGRMSQRDVQVTAGGAVYRSGVEGHRSSVFAASFS